MEEEFTFDLSVEDILYQKFLLQICKTCDDIYSVERKVVDISFDEKQRMAEEMLGFVAYALNNLKGSLIRFKQKPKDFDKKLKEFAKVLSSKAEKDRFSKFVLSSYVLEKKIPTNRIPGSLTLATLVLLSKGEKLVADKLEKELKKVKPFNIRVASLISPFIELYEKLQKEVRKGNIEVGDALKRGKIDKDTLRYIG